MNANSVSFFYTKTLLNPTTLGLGTDITDMESHATMRLTCIRKLHHFISSALSKEKTALRAYVCQASKVLWSISIRKGQSKMPCREQGRCYKVLGSR